MSDRGTLEILAAAVAARFGRELKESIPSGIGFAILVFDFGKSGNLAYVSNARRADMVKAMREFIAKVEGDGVRSVFEGPRS